LNIDVTSHVGDFDGGSVHRDRCIPGDVFRFSLFLLSFDRAIQESDLIHYANMNQAVARRGVLVNLVLDGSLEKQILGACGFGVQVQVNVNSHRILPAAARIRRDQQET
jgi:hypothetical protein